MDRRIQRPDKIDRREETMERTRHIDGQTRTRDGRDTWTHGQMTGYMDAWMNGSIDGCVDGWMDEWTTDGWLNEWMDG